VGLGLTDAEGDTDGLEDDDGDAEAEADAGVEPEWQATSAKLIHATAAAILGKRGITNLPARLRDYSTDSSDGRRYRWDAYFR
jgi:hypothetical protein